MEIYASPIPLTFDQLTPGLVITVRNPGGLVVYRGTVARIMREDVPTVALYSIGGWREETRFAADMGLIPYASGQWSEHQRTFDDMFVYPRDAFRQSFELKPANY